MGSDEKQTWKTQEETARTRLNKYSGVGGLLLSLVDSGQQYVSLAITLEHRYFFGARKLKSFASGSAGLSPYLRL